MLALQQRWAPPPASGPALTCPADPLQVPVQLPLDLLLPPQLQKLAAVLHALPLFGKFTAGTLITRDGRYRPFHPNPTPKSTDIWSRGTNELFVVPAGRRDDDECNSFEVFPIKTNILLKIREQLQPKFGKMSNLLLKPFNVFPFFKKKSQIFSMFFPKTGKKHLVHF